MFCEWEVLNNTRSSERKLEETSIYLLNDIISYNFVHVTYVFFIISYIGHNICVYQPSYRKLTSMFYPLEVQSKIYIYHRFVET